MLSLLIMGTAQSTQTGSRGTSIGIGDVSRMGVSNIGQCIGIDWANVHSPDGGLGGGGDFGVIDFLSKYRLVGAGARPIAGI
ncbi:uncharacterized protein BDV14DRAFT_183301 [Aspergillus stella-maris]|uniref:uncharacterized protein n=1 Tax=Aspergillus stella-maris TaxID=1810926 RepID=UPI003CCD34B4